MLIWPWSVHANILSQFSNDLRIMGYDERFRAKVIQAALTGYMRHCELVNSGALPLHRPREFEAENRKNKKLMSRDRAWLKPQYHVTAFYPATPRGRKM